MPARAGTFVAFFRGINVGTAKRIAMSDLRAVLGTLGYADVRTLLNSGNAVFVASGTPAALAAGIEAAVESRLKVSSRVIVMSASEVKAAIASNPLVREGRHPSRLLVAVLRDAAVARRLQPLAQREWTPEAIALGKRVVYLWCPGGVAASELLESAGRIAGTEMTVRNFATFTRLAALAAE